MQRARSLSKAPAKSTRFEAILASTLMHIEPGDFVSPPLVSPIVDLLASERTSTRKRTKSTPAPAQPLPPTQRLATATGIAQGLKLAATKRLALYYTDASPTTARTEQGWPEALTYATRAQLPLLLVVADATSGKSTGNPSAITWPSVSRLAKKLRLPILTVDGSDAVAVYRVMQESSARARVGDGPAVLWCVLPQPGSATPASDPIRHMKSYLAVRNLLPRKTSTTAKKSGR